MPLCCRPWCWRCWQCSQCHWQCRLRWLLNAGLCGPPRCPPPLRRHRHLGRCPNRVTCIRRTACHLSIPWAIRALATRATPGPSSTDRCCCTCLPVPGLAFVPVPADTRAPGLLPLLRPLLLLFLLLQDRPTGSGSPCCVLRADRAWTCGLAGHPPSPCILGPGWPRASLFADSYCFHSHSPVSVPSSVPVRRPATAGINGPPVL